MYCTKDCNCSLCRELRGFKPIKPAKKPAPRPPSTSIFGRLNENFILRRRASSSLKTFQPQSLKCSEMCQQRDLGHIYDFCKRQTNTPSPTPITQAPSPVLDKKGNKPQTPPKLNHKVVIYFGDSLAYRGKSNGKDVNKDLLLMENEEDDKENEENAKKKLEATTLPLTSDKEMIVNNQVPNVVGSGSYFSSDSSSSADLKNDELPAYIESVENGVINIKIEGNYQRASALVEKVSKPTQAVVGKPKDISDDEGSEDGDVTVSEPCDWSFVQEWRAR